MIFQFFKKVLIFLILLVAISCQNPQILTRISNEKQLKDIMTKNVKAAIIYIYSPTNQCDNCQKIIESLANNLDGIIDSYSIFCDKFDQTTHNLEICINYYNKIIELPEVSLIEPNQDQSYKKHIIRIQDLDFKLLKTLVSKLSPLYSKSLNTFSDLENFLNDSKHNFNKVLYFYKNQEIPLIFKGLTSLYKDRLQFAHCKSNNKEVLDYYQIQNFPAFILLKRNKAKNNDFFKFEFKNKFNMTNLSKFLNKYAFPQKIKQHAAPSVSEVRNYLFKYEELENEWNVVQESNFNATQGFNQFKKEKMTLLHITNGKTPFPLYSQIIERMSNTLNYVSMNCSRKPENLIFAEHTMETKQFPTAYLYHYNKTVLKNISLPINSSFNEILKQISDIIIDKSIQVDSEDNFEIYLGKSFDEDKIAIVLFHESDTISISFRTFGYLTKYLNHFKFLNYRNASETVKAKYGVKKTPKILAIIPQSIINSEGGTLVVGYEGIFIYHEIAKFFHNVFYLSTVLIKYKGDELSNLVILLENQKMFENFCVSEKYLFCLIGFLDEKEPANLKKYLDIFKKIKGQFHQINFHTLWVNVTCHKELVKSFNLVNKNLPKVVLYNQATSKFSTLDNEFSHGQLIAFIMKFLKNPNELSYYYGTSEFFKALNGKCDDQIEKFKRKDEL